LRGHVALETVTFVEQDGKTKLTSTVLFESLEDRDGMLRSGMERGAAETWDRLAEHLDERRGKGEMSTREDSATESSDREVLITRVFDAPRELVWKAWTDPKDLVHWWGPKGFTNTFQEIDVRPGGVWRFVMHAPRRPRLPEQDRL